MNGPLALAARCVVVQEERLRTQIQELELTASQAEMHHHGEQADREETLSLAQSDIRTLEERLAYYQRQVGGGTEGGREGGDPLSGPE